jgi:signal peptidase I
MKYLILLFLILLAGCQTNNVDVSIVPVQQCNIQQVQKIVNGNSMEPMIKNGEEITMLENYYSCNPVQKDDIVIHNYAGSNNPVIKKVYATSSDYVDIQDNKLLINGWIMKNSASQEYTFSKNEINMLSLYIDNGHIPANSYFIFGDNTQYSTDSRKFGAVSKDDFLGKVLH